MNIKKMIKSTLVSAAILSVPALSTSAQAVPSNLSPGSTCKAYYAGTQNRVNYYSGVIKAKSSVRVICPLGQLKDYRAGRREYVSVSLTNGSGGAAPRCHVVETGGAGYHRWTRLEDAGSGHLHYGLFRIITKRRSTSALSVSCVLSKNDYISTVDAIQR